MLDDYGKGVSAWAATSKKALLAVHRLQRAVVDGNVRDTEKLRQAAVQAAATAAEQADESQPLVFDAGAYLTGSGAFLEEIQDAAERAGVQLYVRNGLIFCYPVIVTPEPALSAVRVDKRLDPSIRPDALAAVLKKAQSKEPRDRPDQFIESLFAAYDIVRAQRGIEEYIDVSLARIYGILTLLPGLKSEYSELDFTRDIYFLDRSDVNQTRRGSYVSLTASTVSRERSCKVYQFVARDGTEKDYAGVKFTKPV